MSRHRNIRTINADEEYDDYHSCYGHSFEDDYCVSPGTESQFLYNRATHNQGISIFGSTEPVPEEDSGDESLNKSDSSQRLSDLSSLQYAKLQSCLEALQDIVGETIPETVLKAAAMENDFDLERTLNFVLQDQAPKPPRVKKVGTPASFEKDEVLLQAEAGRQVKNKDSTRLHTSLSLESSDDSKLTKENVLSNTDAVKQVKNVNIRQFNTLSSLENCDKNKPKEHKFLGSSLLEEKVVPILSTDLPSNYDSFKSEDSKLTTHVTPSNKEKLSSSLLESKDKSDLINNKGKELYNMQRKESKPLINLVVIGHVDAGKSTLMGHLLYNLGNVSQKNMHKFEKESQKLGKGSFKYAWVLDETPEERNRGITMDVAHSSFETNHRIINLLDAPGHKDFIPNMITGASQADVAILVVDATKGEFETGFETGGQTREHTMLIRSLGVGEMAIAINKMDNVSWDEQRFKDIKTKMLPFLKQVGFKENDVAFIPCSGLSGENLTDKSKKLNWYSGFTLVEAIDNFQAPQRSVEKSFRLCVNDVFKGLTGGISADGRIEAGFVKNGDKVIVMPAGELSMVKGISIDDKAVLYGFAGDHVIVTFTGIDSNSISTGSVICSPTNPIKVTSRFEACLVIFNIALPITRGFPVILHYQSLSEQAVIKKLISQISRTTGQVTKHKPRCIVKNSSAVVEIEVNRPICLELAKEFKNLGRFMLRTGGCTIAAGLVNKIL